jgi:hypothetical protein
MAVYATTSLTITALARRSELRVGFPLRNSISPTEALFITTNSSCLKENEMIPRKTSVTIVLVTFLTVGAVALPVGAQSQKDRLEQILSVLRSFGDASTTQSSPLT